MAGNVWLGFMLCFIVSTAIAAMIAPESNSGFADEASVITVVSIVALSIERLIELFWTMVGQAKGFGGYWPLKQILSSIEVVEGETNKLLVPFFQNTTQHLTALKSGLKAGDEALDKIDAKLIELQDAHKKLQTRLAAAQTLAPGSARFAMTTQVASDASSVLMRAVNATDATSKSLAEAVATASNQAAVATTIVASFADNPARRVASLSLGASLGVITAGWFGLNVFEAILEPASGWASGRLGILVTGIAIGLGSSPTHELIKSLQVYKEDRRSKDRAAKIASEPDDILAGLQVAGIGGPKFLRVREQEFASESILIRSTD